MEKYNARPNSRKVPGKVHKKSEKTVINFNVIKGFLKIYVIEN
jgi:hypothetical protein